MSKISPYDRMQVTTAANGESDAYSAKYIGLIDGMAMLASQPVGDHDNLRLNSGDLIKVRVLLPDGIFKFQSQVLQFIDVSGGYLHLGLPEVVEIENTRRWPRAEVSEQVSVMGQLGFPDGSKSLQAKMTNISLGGALIKAEAPLGEVGDSLLFTCPFSLGSVDRELQIPCVIRQLRSQEDKTTGVVKSLHGVEFEMSEEEEKIFLHGYVLEQLYQAKTQRSSG